MVLRKKGIFNVPPALIIHAIIVIACLVLIYTLVSSLFSFPTNANAENELKNFIGVVKAFDESKEETLETYVLFDGSYMFVMFDGTTRGIGGKTIHDEGGTGVVHNTCTKKCVCAVGLQESEVSTSSEPSFPILACEDFSKQLIVDKDIQSRVEGWVVSPNAGITGVGKDKKPLREKYGLAETPYDLLVLGAVPNKDKEPEIGRTVTLIKKDGRIIVHSEELGAAPEAGGELEVELPPVYCSLSGEYCKGKPYDECLPDGTLCLNDKKQSRAELTDDVPICRSFTAPEGRCPSK